MEHLQELSIGDDQQSVRISHYIIQSINSYKKLKRFLYICQHWIRDTYLVEELEEIVYKIELWQCQKINEKIQRKHCVKYISLIV